MNSKFFTNSAENTLFNKLEGIFQHNQSINNFDVLVGYFRSSGYFKLRPLLENVASIRILVGIDVDKITKEMHADGLALFKGDREKSIKDWQGKFIADVHEANYEQQTEQGIKQFIADIQTGQVQIKAHPSRAIHAKIYIFRPDDYNPHKGGSVITGSSNLTDAGLGTGNNANYEFNVLLNDYNDIQFASAEFEKLWQEAMEILPQVTEDSLRKTHLADNITPYELYLKCLIEYFGAEIEFDPNSIKDLPADFKRLSYQMDAVNEGWQMLKKHNGFFLADVVGLGKTVIAVLIARQFYYSNGYPDYRSKILLVIPPALKQNWVDTLKSFSIDDAFKIITNGSLHKISNAKDYDMVIVDEAHKFRNDTAEAYDQLQRICKTKTEHDKDKGGRDKKVMLISATPLNNRPDDLYNQILLFQDGNNSTLDFPLGSFFSKAKKEYKDILNLTDKHQAGQKTAALYEKIREKAITPLMVRRTRTDLLANKRYQQDLLEHGVVFPKTTPPKPVYCQLEAELEKLYDDTIEKIDNKHQSKSGLLHTRYRALHYLKPRLKQQYTRADFVSTQLVAIMRTLLLKRMDSSFYAFRQTLERFIRSSEAMLKMIDNNKIIIAPNLDVTSHVLDGNEDELMEVIAIESLTDPSIIVCCRDDFEAGFIDGIKHDYALLKTMKSDWDNITEEIGDPKLHEFLTQLPNFLDKANNPEQKIVLFTESTDTMRYLTAEIEQTKYGEKTLSVNAQNRNALKQVIAQNFDANTETQSNAYQIILTTDVLAEGVNLHRANTVINYDTPWNATKLMQRIGRVNRIGQTASRIFAYNFYPTAQIDDDIALRRKALIKLQAFHSALGEDSQIYSTDEEVDTFGIFDENFKEEVNETIPFLEEIRQFRKNDPVAYKRIKALPSKVRNAVKNTAHQGGTLVFARTKGKGSSRFYVVKPNLGNVGNASNDNNIAPFIKIYSFIQTAKLLKCNPDTKATKLPEQHHSQVVSALNKFKQETAQDIVNENQNNILAVVEKKAIHFLKAMLALSEINAANDEEPDKIKLAIEQIKQKRFQNLSRDINKLSKNTKEIKPVVVLERTLNIIQKYDLNRHTEDNQNKPQKSKNVQPTIVISQSYT